MITLNRTKRQVTPEGVYFFYRSKLPPEYSVIITMRVYDSVVSSLEVFNATDDSGLISENIITRLKVAGMTEYQAICLLSNLFQQPVNLTDEEGKYINGCRYFAPIPCK